MSLEKSREPTGINVRFSHKIPNRLTAFKGIGDALIAVVPFDFLILEIG